MTQVRYRLAPWFAPTAYAFCVGVVGIVFGSVLVAAARAYGWDRGSGIAGSLGVLLLSLIAGLVAYRIVRDARYLMTDQTGLTVSVDGRLRHVAWSGIKSVTRVENRGGILLDLETDAGPVKIYPLRYRNSESLLEVLLANLSPTVVWRDG